MTARDEFIENMMQQLDLPLAAVEKAVAALEAKGLIEYVEADDKLAPTDKAMGELAELPWKDSPTWKDSPDGPLTYTRAKH